MTRWNRLMMIAALSLCSCSKTPSDVGKTPETMEEKASYGIGLEMGRNFSHQEFAVDVDLLVRGVEDGLSGTDPVVDEEELRQAIGESRRQAMAAIGERNRITGEAFLAANRDQEGVVVLPSGLQYQELEVGTGPVPAPSDRVVLHYRGTLLDGTEFENTRKEGQPETVTLDTLIPALKEALLLMHVGSRWRLFAPPKLALGEKGSNVIGPNTTLVFEIELLGIESGA